MSCTSYISVQQKVVIVIRNIKAQCAVSAGQLLTGYRNNHVEWQSAFSYLSLASYILIEKIRAEVSTTKTFIIVQVKFFLFFPISKFSICEYTTIMC